jgi:hypothetical protein
LDITPSENRKLVKCIHRCKKHLKQLKPETHVERVFAYMASEEIKTLDDALKDNSRPVLKSWLDVPVPLFSAQETAEEYIFTKMKEMFAIHLPEIRVSCGRDDEGFPLFTAFYKYNFWATVVLQIYFDCFSPMITHVNVYSAKGEHLELQLSEKRSEWDPQLEKLLNEMKKWL